MRVSSQGVTVVALLADPDAPTEIAQRMAQTLPTRLADKSGQGRRFDVEVVSEPFTSGTEDPPTLMRRIMDRGSAENWDIVVALTDLPLHSNGCKLVVNLSHEHGLALLSLPSLGGLRLQTRARRAVEEAVLSLAGPQATGAEGRPQSQPLLGPFAGRLTPIHPSPAGEEETAGLRYVVSGPGGYLRVLVGMVRANRPWRLVPGLSKALAAALATGAVATLNSTVWSLAEALSAPRLVIAMVGSVAIMIGWLIVDAQLWHRSAEGSPEARQRARLYNASTVVTVGIGARLLCGFDGHQLGVGAVHPQRPSVRFHDTNPAARHGVLDVVLVRRFGRHRGRRAGIRLGERRGDPGSRLLQARTGTSSHAPRRPR